MEISVESLTCLKRLEINLPRRRPFMPVHSLHGLSLSTKGSSQGRLATGAPNMHAHPWFLGIERPPRKKNLQISRLSTLHRASPSACDLTLANLPRAWARNAKPLAGMPCAALVVLLAWKDLAHVTEWHA